MAFADRLIQRDRRGEKKKRKKKGKGPIDPHVNGESNGSIAIALWLIISFVNLAAG